MTVIIHQYSQFNQLIIQNRFGSDLKKERIKQMNVIQNDDDFLLWCENHRTVDFKDFKNTFKEKLDAE